LRSCHPPPPLPPGFCMLLWGKSGEGVFTLKYSIFLNYIYTPSASFGIESITRVWEPTGVTTLYKDSQCTQQQRQCNIPEDTHHGAIYKREKYLCKKIEVKERRGHLLEGGIFLRTHGITPSCHPDTESTINSLIDTYTHLHTYTPTM